MRLRTSISDAFRHRVRLVPDDVLQPPTVILQGKGEAPGIPINCLDSSISSNLFVLLVYLPQRPD